MAHPMKKEGVTGHNEKLRRYTEHYGAADPAMNKAAPVTRLKQEGPEDSVGFGADYDAASARADRPARRSAAANPVATYKRGGRAHEREKAEARAMGGSVISRARGGRAKTNVNVVIMPPNGNQPGTMDTSPVMPGAAVPPMAPPKAPPGPMAAGLPPGAMPPGAVPPGLIPPRKRGGKVEHSDVKEDRALVKSMVKDEALKHRARGGKVNKIHMTAGAESGPGRLEKTAARARNARGERPQTV